MDKIILKSGKAYNRNDFQLSQILKNEQLLNELEMEDLPEVFQKAFGIYCEDYYKPILLKKIELYDQSSNVNSFVYKGNSYWLDKQQRSCMKTVAECGLENIEIVFGDQNITLPAEFVKQFILNLEAYAYKCYINTAKHLQNAQNLYKYSDILNYNYKTGYPEKIILE